MPISSKRSVSLPIILIRETTIYLLFFLLVCVFTYPLILHPASSLRGLNDPYLFTWILNWAAGHVYSNPAGLFDANIFYPYGDTFAYSEPLLVPALLTAAPLLKLTGNPVLAHNLTLLIFQALCGWSAYFATSRITGSRAAGWIAGIAFSVSPFRTGYYNYINVHMQFAIPLALVSLSLFLEKRKTGYLVATVLLIWLQMSTIFYGGVPLSLLLALFFAGYILLRPFGCRPRTYIQLLGGGIVLMLLLSPVLWPYFKVFKELGLERSLKDVHRYSADWYSFFDAGKDHNFYRLANSGKYPGFFPGFTIYILSAIALLSLWTKEKNSAGILWIWVQRCIGAVVSVFLFLTALLLIRKTGIVSLPSFLGLHISLEQTTLGILMAGILALGIRGWSRRKFVQPDLDHRDWIMILGLLALFFALLTLGPIMYIKGKAVGTGIYTYLYDVFLPIHTIRLSIRLGYMPVLLLAMLAGFGLVILQRNLPRRLRPFIWIVPLLVIIEYSSFPLRYQRIDWNATPPVYQWLVKQKGDFAVLEWPSNNEAVDSKYVFWSLKHNKMEVTGVSGFFPPFTQQVVKAMIRFPTADSITSLRRIYPLRYLIIHGNNFLKPEHRQLATAWAADVPKGMKLVKQFSYTSVFEFENRPETVANWQRTFSSALVRKYPVAVFTLAIKTTDPDDDGRRHAVEVEFNGHFVQRIAVGATPERYRVILPGPFPAAERNVLKLIKSTKCSAMTISNFSLAENHDDLGQN